MNSAYSNHSFDLIQQIANEFTEADRKAGLSTTLHGYSAGNLRIAREAVMSSGSSATESQILVNAHKLRLSTQSSM